MNTEDRVTGLIADANPVPGTSPRSPQELAEAERVMQRVLSDVPEPSTPAIRRSSGGIAAVGASLLVVSVVVAVLLLGHVRPARNSHAVKSSSGSFPFTSTQRGLGPPATNLPPGKLVLAKLGIHAGSRYFIYGQRIRFMGRLYFCLSGGNANGNFQICPPWPLTREPMRPLIGGFSGRRLLLAIAVVPRERTCMFVGIPGGPYPTSQVHIPTSLKVDGKIAYAFVKGFGNGGARLPRGASQTIIGVGTPARARCGA